MVVDEKISQLVNEKFAGTNCFLVEVKISGQNAKIQILVDCDSGIIIEECVKLSRYLEQQIELQHLMVEPYVLEVSSPGIGTPFKLQRQYTKSINRNVEIVLLDGNVVEGVLRAVTGTDITLEKGIVHLGKPKPGGKKESGEPVVLILPFTQIKTAKEKIVF